MILFELRIFFPTVAELFINLLLNVDDEVSLIILDIIYDVLSLIYLFRTALNLLLLGQIKAWQLFLINTWHNAIVAFIVKFRILKLIGWATVVLLKVMLNLELVKHHLLVNLLLPIIILTVVFIDSLLANDLVIRLENVWARSLVFLLFVLDP